MATSRALLPGRATSRLATVARGGAEPRHRRSRRSGTPGTAGRRRRVPGAGGLEVCANAVPHRLDLETFERLIVAGVQRLHAVGADVVPVDDRRAPACSATTPSPRAGSGTGIRPPGPSPRASCTTTTGASAASPGRWPPCRRVWIRAGRRAAHRWPSGGRRAPNAPNGRGEGYPAPSLPSSPSGNPAERSPAAKCSRSSTRSNGLVLRKRCTV